MLKMKYQKRKRKARAGEEKALECETFLFSFYIFTIEEINICIEWAKMGYIFVLLVTGCIILYQKRSQQDERKKDEKF